LLAFNRTTHGGIFLLSLAVAMFVYVFVLHIAVLLCFILVFVDSFECLGFFLTSWDRNRWWEIEYFFKFYLFIYFI